jgi:hypothetical protein
MLDEVYGDHIHQNLGTQLDGGMTDDVMWQGYWQQLIACPSSTYDVPSWAIGKRLILKIAEELKGLKSQKWNSNQFILFSSLLGFFSAPEMLKEPMTFVMELWGTLMPGRQVSLPCW